MTMIRSAIDMASIWSCVTYRVVAFRRSWRVRSSPHISSRISASRAPSGSSIRNAFGSRTMARPSATRWRSPPASSDTRRWRKCSMRRSAAVSSTRRRRSLRGTPWHFRGKAMLSNTFMCGYRAKSWNMNAMSRCDARSVVTSSPSNRICPEVGSLQTGDHPQRRRLAASGRTQHDEELPAPDRERGIVHGDEFAEPLLDVADADVGHHVTPGSGSR